MEWELIGLLIVGPGHCVSLSRVYELYTALYHKTWKKKTGKLKKLLEVTYNDISLAVEDGFVYYTVKNTNYYKNWTNEERVKRLFKWGESITFDQICKMYSIIYKEPLKLSKENISNILTPVRKKFFTGPQVVTTEVPSQADINRSIEKIKLDSQFGKSHSVNFEHDLIADDLDDIGDEDLYNIPEKRKVGDATEQIAKIPKIESQYKTRSSDYTYELFNQINKVLK